MLDVPEIIKQRFRSNNVRADTVKYLEMAFFSSGIDTLYPSNNLYPSDDLYPADAGEPWLRIESDRICSETLSLTESLCSSDDLVLGSCEAAMIEIVVADVEDEMVEREFAASLTIGDYKMAYGMYTVSSVVRQADWRKRKITAYDRMTWFDIDVSDWYNAQYPAADTTQTLKKLRDSLCAFCGVPQQDTALINDSLMIGKTIAPQALNGRDVLKAICEINGVYGHIDRTGQLVYVRLQESGLYPSDTLYPSDNLYPISGWGSAEDLEHYRTITYEDYVTAGIDRIQIRMEDGDIGATSSAVTAGGSNTYVIEGNMLTYGLDSTALTQLAQSICDAVGGREYRPAKIVTYAMPWLEVGDGVRAITTDTEICTYVLKRTMKGIQAMSDTVESKGNKAMEQRPDIRTEILQLKGRTTKIVKSIDEVSVTIGDLEKNTTAQIKALSDSIVLKVDKGDVSNQVSVETDGVSIKGNRFSWESTFSSMTSDGKLSATSGRFSGDVIANAFKTLDGKIVLENGKLIITGAEINGTANTSTIGANVIHCNSLNVAQNIVCQEVQPNSVYCGSSGSFGELYIRNRWWDGWSVTSEVQLIHNAVFNGSDRTIKNNIQDIDRSKALEFIKRFRAVSFNYIEDGSPGVGGIAQEIQEMQGEIGTAYPLVGIDGRTGKYYVDYKGIIPILIAAIQDILVGGHGKEITIEKQ